MTLHERVAAIRSRLDEPAVRDAVLASYAVVMFTTAQNKRTAQERAIYAHAQDINVLDESERLIAILELVVHQGWLENTEREIALHDSKAAPPS